jgi:hypothetical protein
MENQPKTIEELILEQHERQERFSYRHYTMLVMAVQQELGQLTTDLLSLYKFHTIPEKWEGAYLNWEKVQQDAITSAVTRAARFLEMGEYISKRSGWPAGREEVIRSSLSNWKYGPGEWEEPYLQIISDAGMMAYYLTDKPTLSNLGMSDRIRRMIYWSFALIYRIQNKR